MSILAYVGFPGCGKSYSVVEQQLLPALRAKRVVVTNLPLNMDRLKKDFPGCDVRDFPTAAITAQPELILDAVPPGAVLLLDEVMKLFPAGTKANQVPEPYRLMFAEHRHRVDAAGQSTQIVLICQDLNQIGTFCRALVEQTFRMTKLSTLGIPSSTRFRVDMYPGPQCGPNPPAAQRIRQTFGRYKKDVYQYYVSHTQSESNTDDGADEEKVDKRANVFKKPFFVMIPFMLVAVVLIIWFKGGYLLDKYHKKPDAAHAPSAGGAPSASPAPAHPSLVGSVIAKVEGAGDWIVLGTLLNADHPEKSLALLHSEALKRNVEVHLQNCFVIVEQPTRCPYDGFMYSSDGKAAPVVDSRPGVLPPVPPTPVLPPSLASTPGFDPYALEELQEDGHGRVEFHKLRVSRGGISAAQIR